MVQFHHTVAVILQRKGATVHCISPHATVFEALEKLAEKNVGALVVMDGTDVVGVFSERDYVRKVIIKGFSSKVLEVAEIMSSGPTTVSPKTTIDACMQLMTDKRCRHLPVVDEGKLVGIVSIGDLVDWVLKAQDHTIGQLEGYITGKYPA